MTAGAGAIRSTYERLKEDRDPYVQRGREAATLTLSHLLRENEEADSTRQELVQPFQSMGARGVNNLASKLLLSLFPINQTFFRYLADVSDMKALEPQERTEVEAALADNERALVWEFETTNMRTKAFESLRHLVGVGNVLFDLREPRVRVYHLDSYVVERDPRGTPLTIILRETVSPKTLSEEIRKSIGEREMEEAIEGTRTKEQYVGVYTAVCLQDDGRYRQTVEIAGREVPRHTVNYKADVLPLLPLRFHIVDGEDYGRGHVEEYIGDLRSLEGLNQSIIEAAAAAARVVCLVDPASPTDAKTLDRARNGAVVAGRAGDVGFVQVQKHADMSVVLNLIQRIERRLEFGFLLNSTRDAERVTAEEIRMVASELEDQLGGVFSLLATEMQLPIVRVLTERLTSAGRIARMRDNIRPSIATGLAAIGRNHEFLKLRQWYTTMLELGGERAQAAMRMTAIGHRLGFALSLDTEELLMSDEELAAAQRQAQLAALVQQLGPEAIRQLGPTLTSGLQGVAEQRAAQPAA